MDHALWIAGTKVSREALAESDVAGVQKLLKHDYERGVRPLCLCRPTRPIMVVRKLTSRYVLARMPGSGPDHHPDCESYLSPAEWCGRSAYNRKAIEEREDGTVLIRLDHPLVADKPQLASQPAKRHPDGPAVKRDSATLLGMLHYFWEHAGLNRWSPRMLDERGRLKRGWWTVAQSAQDFAEVSYVRRELLADVLFTPAPFDLEQRAQQCAALRDFMLRRLVSPQGTTRHALLLAEIAAIKPTEYGARVDLKHLKEFSFWASAAVLDELRTRFPRAIAALQPSKTAHAPDQSPTPDGDRLVGIFRLGAAKREDHFQILEAGLLRVTQHWIPVESNYEAAVALALVRAGQRFSKPMRYDAAHEAVFPDFLLRHGDYDLPMEVFGWSDEAYNVRKRAKIAYYRATGLPFWYWDVTEHGNALGDWPAIPHANLPASRPA